MARILVIHGPNLNMLGLREPDIYGRMTLPELNGRLVALGKGANVVVDTYQSNHEGDLIDQIQAAREHYDGIILNAGGFTHTSVALRDAIAAIKCPVIEVHLSNIHAREEFRHKSLIAPVCKGSIMGLGWRSYSLALQAFIEILNETI